MLYILYLLLLINFIATAREERTENTLYQELQFQEPDALADVDEGAEITGKLVKHTHTHIYV